MTKIEELIESIRGKQITGYMVHQDFQESDIEGIMKEYAEFYAKKCLKIADGEFGWDHDLEEYTSEMKPSDIDLPPHQ